MDILDVRIQFLKLGLAPAQQIFYFYSVTHAKDTFYFAPGCGFIVFYFVDFTKIIISHAKVVLVVFGAAPSLYLYKYRSV